MTKPRFVLRYRGSGPKPEADVARVSDLSDAVVVDSSSRMLLVESDAEPLQALIDSLPDWVMAPEQEYALPDTRKKAVRPPPTPEP
ncbi:MAG: hypothetical protein AVDCRST_MAG76-1726 [uncultured Acidimicrobiales bacterium]|uniref:Uncharacterized protein n=1 Tax=uncultured Acidimicrobiales bacterium TaxID=310071 RepID=A0A6J4I4I6_9ACTN|nr:MAG: hypothetical protein AVDCRST_MAG76-1726 [uncultured Acidimicrobiales bacterium]